jgi:hypothetical protein
VQVGEDLGRAGEFAGGTESGRTKRFCWGRLLAIGAFVFLACGSQGFQQDQLGSEKPEAIHGGSHVAGVRPGVPTPGQSPAAARNEREKQIAEDSATLLKLATELKAEADKTTLDTLSLGIIRKADEVGKLARSMRKEVEDIRPSADAEKLK